MASTYTVNIGIEKPFPGDQEGAWATTVNGNFDLIDEAINGCVSVTLPAVGSSGTPNALPISENNTLSTGRNRFIEFVDGGDLGGTAYVQLTPNDAEKIVHVRNSLSGARSIIIFQGNYNASNDYVLANGTDAVLKFDGGGTGAIVSDVFKKLAVTDLTAGVITATTINATTVTGAPAPAALDDIGDVTITANSSGEILKWNGSAWINNTLSEAGVASSASPTFTGTVSFNGATISNLGTVTTANIDGGTIDGTVIGGAATAAGTFTTVTATTYSGLPAASPTVAGIIELAIQEEVDAGTDAVRAVTPATLASYSGLGAGSIASLTDTTITAVGNLEVLQYSTGTSKWINQTFAEAGIAPAASPTFTGTVAIPTTWSINGTTVTATAAELNYLDITTLGTAAASKAITVSAGSAVTLAGITVTNLGTVTTADIDGGSIDGTAIGAASHTTGKFTTLQATGALTLGAEVIETVYTVTTTTPVLDPANGTVQSWALTGNSTPTSNLATGESITLRIDDGTAYTITWTSILAASKWIGGSAPVLSTVSGGYTWVVLFNVGGTIYGVHTGDTA